jgi:hypothetical protein
MTKARATATTDNPESEFLEFTVLSSKPLEFW